MYQMIKKGNKEKIKEYFFTNPTKRMRVKQIEREVKVSLPSVTKYVKDLQEEGMLKVYEIAGVIAYSADRTSRNFLLQKMLFNIKRIHESGLVNYVKNEFSNPPIVLFGSYSKGEDIEESDIDIYMETSLKTKLDVKNFEKILQRRIQIFQYKTISLVENKHLANNIINGIKLNGFVKVFK